METTAKTEPALEEPTDAQAVIQKYIEAMERMREQMARDQADIDALKASTRAMLAELKAA
jgi:hypothetical protein